MSSLFAPDQEVDIGAYDNSGTAGGFADIDIAEIIIYNTNLSLADRLTIHDYLNSKYGL